MPIPVQREKMISSPKTRSALLKDKHARTPCFYNDHLLAWIQEEIRNLCPGVLGNEIYNEFLSIAAYIIA